MIAGRGGGWGLSPPPQEQQLVKPGLLWVCFVPLESLNSLIIIWICKTLVKKGFKGVRNEKQNADAFSWLIIITLFWFYISYVSLN